MPRTLPWLLNHEIERHVKHESTPRKRVKREHPPDNNRTPINPPASPDRRDFFRSSQTPPTSPARPCPAQEFLIEGLGNDDAWIMVEDEFYAVAQSFTQHLHYAEYIRRKKAAKAQSASAIQEIQRPIDGRTQVPKELLRRKEAEALATRQKTGLAQLGLQREPGENIDEDDEDDVWAGTHLHGLMMSPRKSRSLVGAHAVKSYTRAAAGFGQTPSVAHGRGRLAGNPPSSPPYRAMEAQRVEHDGETTSDEDDDLDGAASTVIATQARSESTPNRRDTSVANIMNHKHDVQESTKRMQSVPARTIPRPVKDFKSRVQMLFDDLDELPEPTRSNTSISDKKKDQPTSDDTQERGPGNNNLVSKRSRYNDVPTFLM